MTQNYLTAMAAMIAWACLVAMVAVQPDEWITTDEARE